VVYTCVNFLRPNNTYFPQKHWPVGIYNDDDFLCEVETEILCTVYMNVSLQRVK
jgi:hypothetical protein